MCPETTETAPNQRGTDAQFVRGDDARVADRLQICSHVSDAVLAGSVRSGMSTIRHKYKIVNPNVSRKPGSTVWRCVAMACLEQSRPA